MSTFLHSATALHEPVCSLDSHSGRGCAGCSKLNFKAFYFSCVLIPNPIVRVNVGKPQICRNLGYLKLSSFISLCCNFNFLSWSPQTGLEMSQPPVKNTIFLSPHILPVILWRPSSVTFASVEMQSRTAATSFTAFAFSFNWHPRNEAHVINTECFMSPSLEMSVWYGACHTYKCEHVSDLQKHYLPTFYPGDLAVTPP